MPRSVKPGASARRPTMPGADELFRPTTKKADEPTAEQASAPATSGSSGRVKHDEKITVYVTSEELLALEQARLAVRAVVGRNVDRGRLVRAALAAAIEDFEAQGEASQLVRRIEATLDGR